MSMLDKLRFWRKPEQELITGWVDDLRLSDLPDGKRSWTLKIRHTAPVGKPLYGAYMHVTSGVEYWDIVLNDEAVSALRQAKESGTPISYCPAILRENSFHEVPWQGFRKVN